MNHFVSLFVLLGYFMSIVFMLPSKISRNDIQNENSLKNLKIKQHNKPLSKADFRRGQQIMGDTHEVKPELTLEEFLNQNDLIKKRAEMLENPELIEGDMLNANENEDDNTRIKRNVISHESGKWDPSGIPYLVDEEFTNEERAMLAAAIDEFHKYTCVRFIDRTNEDHYVTMFKGSPGICYSHVGKNPPGYPQDISFGAGCLGSFRIPLHEIMHTLGFYHEHNRPDRDDYVTVYTGNVTENNTHNFNKREYADVQDTPYDYGSIMHYGKTFFSKDKYTPLLTIEPKNLTWLNKIGYAKGFSQLDVDEINLLYCNGTNPGPPVMEPCIDQYSNCGDYIGECMWTDAIPQLCPQTCNQCSDPPGEMPCSDKYSNCDSMSHLCRYYDDIKDTCLESCNRCSDPRGPLPCGDKWTDCSDNEKHCNSTEKSTKWVKKECHLTCAICT